jgi:hypothetical protein
MRQGSRYLWGTAVAVAALAIAGTAPAAASRAGCFAAVGPGAKKANRSSESGEAIVLRRGGRYYGCSFDRERAHRLPESEDGQILPDSIQVARRNAAYALVFGSGEDANTVVYSIKLRSGKQWVNSARDEVHYGEDVTLTDLVLRGNGTIAWQFSWPEEGDGDPFSVVLGFDHNGNGGPRFHLYEDDSKSDNKIRASTLDLLHDGIGSTGWRITWRHGGGAAPSFRDVN